MANKINAAIQKQKKTIAGVPVFGSKVSVEAVVELEVWPMKEESKAIKRDGHGTGHVSGILDNCGNNVVW